MVQDEAVHLHKVVAPTITVIDITITTVVKQKTGAKLLTPTRHPTKTFT
jgi:hypothetical protein